jgi:hypothetical protein
LCASIPPAEAKLPPAYSAGPDPSSNMHSALTEAYAPLTPPPTLDQLGPFHFAMPCVPSTVIDPPP